MRELKASIKGSRQMHWTDAIYTCLDEQKKPLALKDLRHCIKENMPYGFNWTQKCDTILSVVLSRMQQQKKISHIRYKGYGAFYGRNEWTTMKDETIIFKDFDPYKKDYVQIK